MKKVKKVNTPKLEIEISQKDFDLCEKVANILQMFCEATKLLSKEDCSISNSIPIVAVVLQISFWLGCKNTEEWSAGFS